MTLPNTPHTSTDATTHPGLVPPPTPRSGPAAGSSSDSASARTRGAGTGASGGGGGGPDLYDHLPDYLQNNPQRDAVIRRLALVGVRHARTLDGRHGREDQPGPHAIVFFYTQPHLGPGRVAVASRMFLDGDDVADLDTVLRIIDARAREYRHLDPRRHLAGSTEPMHPDSTYLGVGTSTLLPTIPGSGTYPWHGLACLTDRTHLTADADVHPLAIGGPTAMRVTTTHTLSRNDSILAPAPYAWTWAAPGHHSSPMAHLLVPLAQLHDYLTATQTRTPSVHR